MKNFILIFFTIAFLIQTLEAQSINDSSKAQKMEAAKRQKAVLDSANLTNEDISKALKLTLKMGVDDGISGIRKKRSLFDFGSQINAGPSSLDTILQIAQTVDKLNKADYVEELNNLLNKTRPNIISAIRPVFNNAIQHQDLGDAYALLIAGDIAATKYLKDHSEDQIIEALEPQIDQILTGAGVNDKWSQILSAFNELTGQNISYNLSENFTRDIVRHMFNSMAEDEIKIRTSEFFRNSLLLKSVFALQDGIVIPLPR